MAIAKTVISRSDAYRILESIFSNCSTNFHQDDALDRYQKEGPVVQPGMNGGLR